MEEKSRILHPPAWKFFDKEVNFARYDERWKYLDTERLFLESSRIREVKMNEEFSEHQYDSYDYAAVVKDDKVVFYDRSNFLSSIFGNTTIDKILKEVQIESPRDAMEARALSLISWGLFLDSRKANEKQIFYSISSNIPISLLNVFLIGENSRINIDFKKISQDVFHNFIIIYMEENSNLNLNLFFSSTSFSSVSYFKIILSKDSSLNINLVGSTRSIESLDFYVLLRDEGSNFSYKSLIQSSRGALFNNNLSIYHMNKNTHSKAEIFGITKGGAIVTKEWSNVLYNFSSTSLKGKILLLSKDSKAYSLPSLRTMGHKISASHGISISRVTKNELFYLMSRGLSEEEAVSLILNGFIEAVLSSMESKLLKNEEIKSYIHSSTMV